MPCWWPSFQVNRMPYFPTGSTSVGRARALKIGSVPATGLSGSPGSRPSFPRSSSHSAQGQASRRKTKLYELRWPSFHSMSMPVPVDIEWKDGHRTSYSFVFLRDACPCALCEEERGKDGREPGDPLKPVAGTLPI